MMDEKEIDRLTLNEAMKEFNNMYNLPINRKPTLPSTTMLKNFKSMLSDEVNEVDEIVAKYKDDLSDSEKLDILTSVSDWLADMIWYIRSEATKYGLDMDETLKIIKGSNFSKLGEDGNPIHDERGKVLKGPNYWPPEPKIVDLIRGKLKE
jgi:predicted HAD superfamily Cof-like phosphohydrolase